MKISILIPFFNEEENIANLLKELNIYLTDKSFETEVVMINDGSSDNSVAEIKKSNYLGFVLKLINLSKNFGSHAALRAGISCATGDYICFIYADLQDPLYLIDKLYKKCIVGNDIAWAIRNNTDNSFFEKTFSKFYSLMMRKYAIPTYPPNGFDIVMFSKKVQESLNSNIEANSSIFLQILSLGYKQITIGYNKEARLRGKSKWTISKKIKLFIDSFIAFSFAPIRLVSLVGIVFFIVGLIWSSYIIIRKLTLDDLVSGWPALYSTLLLGFGITNISLGIIAEYLWRTFDVSRKRPPFIIDEIIEFNK